MSYRGGGRPRIHLDDEGRSHAVHAQFLLTPKTHAMLTEMARRQGVARSELIRLLIINAFEVRDK